MHVGKNSYHFPGAPARPVFTSSQATVSYIWAQTYYIASQAQIDSDNPYYMVLTGQAVIADVTVQSCWMLKRAVDDIASKLESAEIKLVAQPEQDYRLFRQLRWLMRAVILFRFIDASARVLERKSFSIDWRNLKKECGSSTSHHDGQDKCQVWLPVD